MTSFRRCLPVLLAVGCLALGACTGATTPTASTSSPTARATPNLSTRPLIFFGALPPYVPHMGYSGSSDYFDLFKPDAPWPTAASKVGVYIIASSFIMNYWTPAQLRQVVTNVAKRGIALGLSIGAFYPKDCGWGIEGYDAGLEPLNKIRDAGGHVDIIIFDEPYAFAVRDPSKGACHWSVERAAREAATFVGQLRGYDPNIIIGEDEPMWQGISANDIAGWLDAYAAATGKPMAFLHMDADWAVADWATTFRAVEGVARTRGVEVGPIYNGGDATSDTQWTDLAMQRAYTHEEILGGRPDHVVLESWHDHPDRVLPETDPNTFTGLINRYLAPRTKIDLSGAGPLGAGRLTVEARLSTRDGAPVASAAISALLTPLDGARQVLSADGVVPDGASSAVAGIRVNTEGAGPGQADLRVYGLTYSQRGGSNVIPNPSFAAGLAKWGVDGHGQVAAAASDAGPGLMLRLRAAPNQRIGINSTGFPVSPGATFHLEIAAAVPEGSASSAYAAVMFLDGNNEVRRFTVALAPAAMNAGRTTTASDGRAVLDLRNLPAGRYRLRLDYAGDLGHWPSWVEREVRIG